MRQVLSNKFKDFHEDHTKAYKTKDLSKLELAENSLLALIDNLDVLLGSREF